MFLERVFELVAGIAAIGEDMAQPWEAIPDGFEHIDGPIPVLDIGGMDEDEDEVAAGIGQDVALATLDLLARIIAANPPLSVVLTLWLSITPALGEASRPSTSRRFITSTVLMLANNPLSRHA